MLQSRLSKCTVMQYLSHNYLESSACKETNIHMDKVPLQNVLQMSCRQKVKSRNVMRRRRSSLVYGTMGPKFL